MRLSASDVAPDFELLDADEQTFSSMLLRGQRAILYFYPAALTPGCTTQACDFRDNLEAFKGSALTVVGISPDQPEKLRKFRETHDLPFALLSDPGHKVLEAYGAWGEKKLYGKTVTGVIRSTIVVDPHGQVEQAFYNVKATGHVAKLMRDLKLAA
jgi:thioredoxin-dependent peroxiredoxin